MAPSQALLLSRGALCRRCLVACIKGASPIRQRSISTGFIKKTKEAEGKWQERAQQIQEGKLPNLWDVLDERGYVKDTAGSKETIRELMRRKRIGAYVGIDPTASSLHVGHLLPLMPLFWMYMHGYRTFTLIGGSTVKIGDPTDRLKSREAISSADLAMNLTKMHYQLKQLWANVEIQARRFGYQKEWAWRRGIVNNNAWWNKMPLLEVLKRVGRSIRIGPMLSRDTVKRKMTEGDGVSFAEFTYPIMQGWDWWELFRQQRIQMQIGGSDQYGNIITGIDIVKTARDNEPDPALRIPAKDEFDEPVGFTVPLLTDSSGAKFGKSAGNALWLDEFMTSTFDLYGYFVRRPDADVEQLLRLFTFLPLSEIQKTMEEQALDPSKRVAQHRLAHEVLMLVHGKAAADAAQAQHRMMFGGGGTGVGTAMPAVTGVPGEEYQAPEGQPTTANNAPRVDMILPESLIRGKSIGRILYAAGLAKSSSEGHRLATQQGAYIGGMPGRKPNQGQAMNPEQLTWNPIKLWFPQETQKYLIDGKLLLLRRGKHNVRVIQMVSDDEYAASGLRYPGQPYTGAVRTLRNQIQALKEGRATPAQVREALRALSAKEDERDAAEAADGMLKFPEEKNPDLSDLEAQLQQLLEEEESKSEKPSNASGVRNKKKRD